MSGYNSPMPKEEFDLFWVTHKEASMAKTTTPAPAGLQRAVCCDVVDLGVVPTQFGNKHMVELRWQVEERRKDGKPFLVLQRYNPSLNPKANLRRDLESWRGQKFNEEQAKKLDLETLLGKNCQLNVVHNPRKDGGVWANVTAVVPPHRGLPPLTVTDYQRKCERPDYKPPVGELEEEESEYTIPEHYMADVEEEVPF